jgi:hypothetical protein
MSEKIDTSPETVARFVEKINYAGPVPAHRPDLGPCWLWTAADNGKNGYGIFRGGTERDKGGSRLWVLAHRYSYELHVGPIPDGHQIDHLCRTRLCVNPAHHEPVSHKENTLRSEGPSAQQARRDHCVRGHPFDKVDNSGRRRCSICDREKEDRRYIRRYGRVPKKREERHG